MSKASNSKNNDGDIEKCIKLLNDNIKAGCILLIGPDAFIHTNGKTLREIFIKAAQKKLGKKAELDTTKDNVLSVTALLQGKIDDRDDWLNEFWTKKVNSEDFPLITSYAQLPFSAYIYLGYDDLLFKALRAHEKNATIFYITGKDEEFKLRSYNENEEEIAKPLINKISRTKHTINKEHQDYITPLINCFGHLGSNIEENSDLVHRIYNLIVDLTGPDNNTDIKKLGSAIDAQHILISGADLSFWHNKMLALLFSQVFKKISPKGFFEQDIFKKQIDSTRFTETMKFQSSDKYPLHKTQEIIDYAIEKLAKKIRISNCKVFLSYSTKDLELAKKVARACLRLSIKPYIAHRERDKGSSHWIPRAKLQLDSKNTEYFLMIGTDYYLPESDAIKFECNLASANVSDHSRKFEILPLNFFKKTPKKGPKSLKVSITWNKVADRNYTKDDITVDELTDYLKEQFNNE